MNFMPVLAFFAMVYGIVYLAIRRKERQMLLEKGADPSIFHFENKSTWQLKWGIFLIGIALGIIVGNILTRTGVMEEEAAYMSAVFIFGGISLVVSYFISKNQAGNKQAK
jgi:predicted MFS family arabinose efflux permease